jgi:hypothetical protein
MNIAVFGGVTLSAEIDVCVLKFVDKEKSSIDMFI